MSIESSNKWKDFWSILWTPGFLIPGLITIISLVISIYQKENILFSSVMAVIGSIFSGVAGSFLNEEWSRVTGRNILEKKGMSAYRNIDNINKQICSVKSWIAVFVKKLKKGEEKRNLEELLRQISIIQFNILSSLED